MGGGDDDRKRCELSRCWKLRDNAVSVGVGVGVDGAFCGMCKRDGTNSRCTYHDETSSLHGKM